MRREARASSIADETRAVPSPVTREERAEREAPIEERTELAVDVVTEIGQAEFHCGVKKQSVSTQTRTERH